MATKGTMKLDQSFARYLDTIAAAGQDVDAAADRAVQAGGAVALEGMRRRVPKDTHNLEGNLSIQAGVSGNVHYVEVGLLSDTDAETARYGNAQEFGTSTMPAQPYVRPTMDEDKKQILGAMRDSLKKDGVV